MSNLPPVVQNLYNYTKYGFCGEMGSGANLIVKYFQTGLSIDDLKDVNLIESIPESYRWNISDLLQRHIDHTRVDKQIMPYLTGDEKVKFFNPITLVILPRENGGIISQPPFITELVSEDAGHVYGTFEMRGVLRLKLHKSEPAFSLLEWHSQKVYLVAIDGQHRLAALKKISENRDREKIANWKIPVIILFINKSSSGHTDSLTEVVRKTFIYINDKSEAVNEARKVLLNDESINSVCTQEFIQVLHENDGKPIESREVKKLPLFAVDWRGEVKRVGDKKASERAKEKYSIFLNIEIRDWFEEYILGKDGSPEQAQVLLLKEMTPPIMSTDVLNHEDARKLRVRFREVFLAGFYYLFEEFEPLKLFIGTCRAIELNLRRNPIAEKVFDRIRYGLYDIGSIPASDFDAMFVSITAEIEKTKSNIHYLLSKDIGMRGVIFSFGYLKGKYDEQTSLTNDWLDFAKVFVPPLNAAYAAGWFKEYDELSPKHKAILTYIAYDSAGTIDNYRIEDIKTGFGALLSLIIVTGNKDNGAKDLAETVWLELRPELEKPLRKGYNKRNKALLADRKLTESARKKEQAELTKQDVAKHIELIRAFFGLNQ